MLGLQKKNSETRKKGARLDRKNNNQINIHQAYEIIDKSKMQAAQEVSVNLTNNYDI